MAATSSSRQVLLVHGAWHGAWSWAGLQSALDALGVASHAIDLPGHGISDLPLGTVSDDADAVVRALDVLGPDTVLVGHSYGGAVITQAASRSANVGRLVYIAAFALDDGESVNGFLRAAPRHSVELAQIMRPDTDHGVTTLDPSAAGPLLYPGVSSDQQAAMVARLSPQSFSSMTTAITGSPRSAIPSTYVVCNRDRAVHPEHQRIMAARCTNTIELDSDHSPFIDDPAGVAALLRDIAIAP
jgi:pimeloyl-ACP methyl ester carboxylesterase